MSAANGTDTGSYTLHIIDDVCDSTYMPQMLWLGFTRQAVIDMASDADYYVFIPSVTDTYVFYTTGQTDTVGVLYDANENQLAANNDCSQTDTNFSIQYTLTAGQRYYLRVTGNNDTGAYTLHTALAT